MRTTQVSQMKSPVVVIVAPPCRFWFSLPLEAAKAIECIRRCSKAQSAAFGSPAAEGPGRPRWWPSCTALEANHQPERLARVRLALPEARLTVAAQPRKRQALAYLWLSSAEITKINADNEDNEKAVHRFAFAVNDGLNLPSNCTLAQVAFVPVPC